MAFTIELTSAAARSLRKLDASALRRVQAAIDGPADEPHPVGSTKLRGSDDVYRIRTGDFRVLYKVDGRALVVLVVDVGNRRDVYR